MTTEDSGPSAQPADVSTLKPDGSNDALSSQRVFKKSSPNGKLTLYLSSRDLVVSQGKIDRLQGVLLVDPEFVENKKVYGQVTLTFRYGREDEEVMGLKFCNEAIMCLAQLYPPHSIAQPPEGNTPLQEALVKRLGPNAYPFSMEITPLAPPSVQLVPAKEYHGAPIGTSYDIRAYIAERADEKFHRRTTVRMGIRVVQRAFAPPSPYLYNPSAFSSSHKERAKDHRKALFGSKSLEVGFPTKDVNHVAARTPEHGCNLDDFSNDNDTKMSSLIKNNVNTGNTRVCGDVDEGKNGVVDKHDADVIPGSQEHNKCTGHGKSHVTFKGPLTNGDDKKSSQGSDLIERCDKPPDENTNNNSPISAKEKNTFDNENLEEYRSLCGGKRPSLAAYLAGVPAPKAAVEKPFLLSDGRVYLAASLDKAIYSHGEEVQVSVHVQNGSNKTIRRIKVFVVQHVDVCMFSNGKFKNVVALINSKEDCPVTSGSIFDKTFTLLPLKSSTKNWIALEDSYTKSGTSLSSTVTCITDNPDERNVFAIYVSYYVKVKLLVSVMGGEVSLKLPFTLMHTCSDFEASETLTKVRRPDATASVELELKMNPSVKPEKDGT